MLQDVVVVETVFFTPGSFVHVCLRVYEGIYSIYNHGARSGTHRLRRRGGGVDHGSTHCCIALSALNRATPQCTMTDIYQYDNGEGIDHVSAGFSYGGG